MHPLSLILFFTAFINIIIAVYTFRFSKSAGAVAYLSLLLCISMYALGYAFEINATTSKSILMWLHFEYVGISFFPTINLLLALQYTGKQWILKKWMMVLMFSISATTLVLQFFNFGNAFYTNYNLAQSGSYLLSNFGKGFWYWVHQAYSNLILLASCIIYIGMIISSIGLNRTRAFIMFLSLLIPWGFYISYLLNLGNSQLDLIPFSFSVVGILGALGMFRYKLLDFEPLALEIVFETITDGVLIIDRKKRLVNFNKTAQKIISELQHADIGHNIEEKLAKHINISTLFNLAKSQSVQLSLYIEGKPKYYTLKVTPVQENKKRLAGWTFLFSDITEHVETEKTLSESAQKLKELNATKDKFFTIIAHDLRQPFNALTNLSDFIVEKLKENKIEEAIEISMMLNQSAKQTFDLLQNLLEWTKVQRKGVKIIGETFSALSVIDEVILSLTQIAVQKQITYNILVPAENKSFADINMAKTIFRNLLSNALKYSFIGSMITISCKQTSSESTFSISDTGIGMTAEEVDSLFKIELSTSKTGTNNEQGTGLGLLLCYDFVKLNSGRLWVESNEGIGSTFYFTLPNEA